MNKHGSAVAETTFADVCTGRDLLNKDWALGQFSGCFFIIDGFLVSLHALCECICLVMSVQRTWISVAHSSCHFLAFCLSLSHALSRSLALSLSVCIGLCVSLSLFRFLSSLSLSLSPSLSLSATLWIELSLSRSLSLTVAVFAWLDVSPCNM